MDVADYDVVLEELRAHGQVSYDTKLTLCRKVFEHTAAYDAMIAKYLRDYTPCEIPDQFTMTYEKVQDMRYGENPHQKAMFFKEIDASPGNPPDGKAAQWQRAFL